MSTSETTLGHRLISNVWHGISNPFDLLNIQRTLIMIFMVDCTSSHVYTITMDLLFLIYQYPRKSFTYIKRTLFFQNNVFYEIYIVETIITP